MVGQIPENAVLDYAIFEIQSSDNSYDAYICSNGSMEKLVSGPLDQLVVHLPKARASCSAPSDGSFKLQMDKSGDGSSWFTRFTLARFLHIVNVPDVLKPANSIVNEISELEETRRVHLALYAKDSVHRSGDGVADVSCLNDLGLTQQVKVETASSDATKNELMRAMDLMLTALKEDLAASFSQAAGAACCSNQISNVADFAHHFGAIELRDFLLKFLELCPDYLPSETSRLKPVSWNDSRNTNEKAARVITQLGQKPDAVKNATTSVSPAKIAEAERQSSSESEDSSDSVDGDQPHAAERSRSFVRSSTPRRSASPMRRIQIGKSGSRRSTGLSIKSLNYFPARERAISIQDVDSSEGRDEVREEPPKKPDNNVKRMSVQDAINLFESKQKDQNADIQKRRTSELAVNANKLVLRRWSAGVCDSFNCSTQEKASYSGQPSDSSNLNPETEEEQNEEKPEFSSADHAYLVMSTETIKTDICLEPVVKSEVLEGKDRASTAEWNRQKEAELNDLLLKMMENKPTKYHGAKIGKAELQDSSIGENSGLYTQYKAKRDEKLRAENARDNITKDAQSKVMRKTLERSKVATASKTIPASLRRESTSPSQRPRRNSSAPVFLGKEDSKPTITKKISSKPAASPKTQTSLPSGPVKRAGITPPTKSSPSVLNMSTPSLQRMQQSNSPAQASPRMARPLQHAKGSKGAQADLKPNWKGQEEKKLKSMTKNSKAVTTRSSEFSDDFVTLSSKPSFHNKFTKKSSVVPLESKPFLRKGSRISPGTGHAVAKVKDAKVMKLDSSSKNSGNLVPTEENESSAATAESIIEVIEDDLVEQTNVINETLAASVNNNMNIETVENLDESLTGTESCMENSVDPSIAEIQPDVDLGISSAAWVEAEHKEYSVVNSSPVIAPTASSSPRVRHSLSQMLQADSGEPEIIEWGNAENPPSLVYQKDAPKGLKRLLQFARKGKGEGNSTGWYSPSVFSEGEDEHEECKAAGKKSSDAILRKASLQAKSYGQPKLIVSESFDGGNSGKRVVNYRVTHDFLSGSDKLRDGQISVGVTSTKATRSFFSLSTFRSGKSSETKPR